MNRVEWMIGIVLLLVCTCRVVIDSQRRARAAEAPAAAGATAITSGRVGAPAAEPTVWTPVGCR